MKIIVVGVGKVGYTIAEQLVAEKHDVTVVDTDAAALEATMEAIDVFCVRGNGASVSTLTEAGANNADMLIAFTENDEINLLSCLVAKKLGVDNALARIRNPEYYESIRLIKNDIGLSLAVNPELECAKEVSRVLDLTAAINVELFSKGKVELLSFVADASNVMCGKEISEQSKRFSSEVLVCAVERGDKVYIPKGSFVIEPGDVVSIITPSGNGVSFLKQAGMPVNDVKHVMIVGGNRTGYYLAKRLLENGKGVTIFEADKDKAESLCVLLPKANVINGDGTDPVLLQEEGLENADAICGLMGIDEENILLSLYARNEAPNIKTITKVNRKSLRNVTKRLDIGSVVSSLQVTAGIVLRYVRAVQNSIGSNVLTLHKIVSNKVEALEFRVSEESAIINTPIESLRLRNELLIACITREGKIIMPHGRDMFLPGDSVVVVTTVQGLDDLDDIVSR